MKELLRTFDLECPPARLDERETCKSERYEVSAMAPKNDRSIYLGALLDIQKVDRERRGVCKHVFAR
jgi:hypothetical protein